MEPDGHDAHALSLLQTQGLGSGHLYVVCKEAVKGEKWRSGSRRTIIEWKKEEEENVIDFLTLILPDATGRTPGLVKKTEIMLVGKLRELFL